MPTTHPRRVRRERGSMMAPVATTYTVEAASKELFDQIAQRCGISSAMFFEAMVAHVATELDPTGIPSWYIPVPTQKGATPIDGL